MSVILSSQVGRNAVVFSDILKLYATGCIADVTYGKGNFWKDNHGEYDRVLSDISTGTDFRDLPYEDASFQMVVFDPPYMYNPKRTVKRSVASTYRLNDEIDITTNEKVLKLYSDGMAECYRVLQIGGFMVVKCQDIIQSGIQRWNHITIYEFAQQLGMYGKDLFVVVQASQPTIRWPHQLHARKNHSYFWVFEKKKVKLPASSGIA